MLTPFSHDLSPSHVNNAIFHRTINTSSASEPPRVLSVLFSNVRRRIRTSPMKTLSMISPVMSYVDLEGTSEVLNVRILATKILRSAMITMSVR